MTYRQYKKLIESRMNEDYDMDGLLTILSNYSRRGDKIKMNAMLVDDNGDLIEIDTYVEDLNRLNFSQDILDFLAEYDVAVPYNVDPKYYQSDYEDEDGETDYEYILRKIEMIRQSSDFHNNDIEEVKLTQNFKPFLIIFVSRTEAGKRKLAKGFN